MDLIQITMQFGKLFVLVMATVLILGFVFITEAEARKHHHNNEGLGALLAAGLLAKILEHKHHGCHHHHG
ncbi:hypothetical protein JTE90_010548 [Oedothorax gibbosus]|uniref:Uncharacterized protein n=1 Tax=Oedothorax gibbosus TaxID=931172 RepID=A0AAV6U3W2_9ARAC|nr:hypothetical protein JTE90_010548 [Oedothorax gibbosus]